MWEENAPPPRGDRMAKLNTQATSATRFQLPAYLQARRQFGKSWTISGSLVERGRIS